MKRVDDEINLSSYLVCPRNFVCWSVGEVLFLEHFQLPEQLNSVDAQPFPLTQSNQ